MSQLFSNNVNSLNTVVNLGNNCTIADDRSQISTWLSPLDPRLRHQDIRDRRAKGVGEWLLQTEEFRSWYDGSERGESDNAVLLCYGDPGVGKTFISSLVIDSLCDQVGGQDVAVTCFYFDRTAQKEQSSTNVLGALLKQVVIGLEEVPGEVVQAYEDQKNCIGGRRPQHTDIVKMLQTTSSKKLTFICVDALDECMPEHRVKLLDSLNQILQKAPATRVFLTEGPDITPKIRRLLTRRVTSLSISLKRGAVTRRPQARLGGDTTLDTMDSLEAEIQKEIPENISQILKRPHEESHLKPSTDRYLLRSPLVSPDIDAIPRKRQKLCTMADGLGLEGACGPTLSRIEGRGGEKARPGEATSKRTLPPGWPLGATPYHALAVGTGSPNLDIDGVPSIGTLLNYRKPPIMADEVSKV